MCSLASQDGESSESGSEEGEEEEEEEDGEEKKGSKAPADGCARADALALLDGTAEAAPIGAKVARKPVAVVLGSTLYLCSSAAAARAFVLDAEAFIAQEPPAPAAPVAAVVLGPPCAGKTSAALAVARATGAIVVNAASAVAYVLEHRPDSPLARACLASIRGGGAVSGRRLLECVVAQVRARGRLCIR